MMISALAILSPQQPPPGLIARPVPLRQTAKSSKNGRKKRLLGWPEVARCRKKPSLAHNGCDSPAVCEHQNGASYKAGKSSAARSHQAKAEVVETIGG